MILDPLAITCAGNSYQIWDNATRKDHTKLFSDTDTSHKLHKDCSES